MGYESKIYIVDVHKENNPNSEDYGKPLWAHTLAVFDLSCMGYHGFRELFDTDIEYDVYVDPNKHTRVDDYGCVLQSADIDKLIMWLENENEIRHYRRIAPFTALLKGFDRKEWECLEVVHYGY